MSLYDRVDAMCKERNISKRQLSISCGFAPSAIGKWKNHDPSFDKIQKVADFFQVPVNQFLDDPDVQRIVLKTYYTYGETSYEAEELSEDQKALMSAIPHLPASKVKALRAIVEEMKGTNPDG